MGVQGHGFAELIEAIQSQQFSRQEAFHYFYHLGEKDNDVSAFKIHWESLPAYSFDRADLVMSIHSIAKKLNDVSERKDKYQGVVQTIEQNTSVWENEALAFINEFDERDLAMTLWSFTSMGIAPSENFMSAMRERAENVFNHQDARYLRGYLWTLAMADRIAPSIENSAHFEQLRSFVKIPHQKRTRKNVYDADLWFRGKSDVKNPIEGDKTHSDGVLDLKKAFEQAGYNVEEFASPVGPLPQAINLVVSKPNGDEKLYIEVGGYNAFLNTGTDDNQKFFYNGRKLFRSGLIEKFTQDKHVLYMGPDMIELFQRAAQSDKAKNEASKSLSNKLCDTIFNSVVNKKSAGVYRARDDSRRAGTKYRPPIIEPFFVQQCRLELVH